MMPLKRIMAVSAALSFVATGHALADDAPPTLENLCEAGPSAYTVIDQGAERRVTPAEFQYCNCRRMTDLLDDTIYEMRMSGTDSGAINQEFNELYSEWVKPACGTKDEHGYYAFTPEEIKPPHMP